MAPQAASLFGVSMETYFSGVGLSDFLRNQTLESLGPNTCTTSLRLPPHQEYISLFADEVPVTDEKRTPLEMYGDWFEAFRRLK